MKFNKLQACMWLGLGLVAGALLMGGWFRLFWGYPPPPPPPDPEHVIRMFGAGLDLSDEQYAGLRRIILANDGWFRALHDEEESKRRALAESVQGEIRKLLNDKQRSEFDRRMAEREERDKKREGRR